MGASVFSALPSGHLVTALPLNFSVIALSFEGLVTFRIIVPRSIAVLRSACSVCSKPWRNSTGSVRAMLTLTPPPEATGFSSGSDLMLLMTLLADDLPDESWESDREGLAASCPKAPTAPGFRADARISLGVQDWRLSGKEATEARLLLAVDCGTTTSAGSGLEGGVKWVSMKERR
jgi:hypothetical protein